MEKDFKEFHDALEKLAYKDGNDTIKAFEEFMEYAIVGHSHTIKKDYSKHTKEKLQLLCNVYCKWILLFNKMVVEKKRGWFDAFGTYFEEYSSSWSRQKRGQFFTPSHVCDFMVLITGVNDKSGQRIIDPACGSGRLVLASHAVNPKNFHFAIDIDRTCCMMTALNMMIHGIRGEVVWKNALDPFDYMGGWCINPRIVEFKGIPHIEALEKENSYIYNSDLEHMIKKQIKKQEKEQQEAEQISKDFLDIKEENKVIVNKDEKADFNFF